MNKKIVVTIAAAALLLAAPAAAHRDPIPAPGQGTPIVLPPGCVPPVVSCG